MFRKNVSVERLEEVASLFEKQIRHTNRYTMYPVQAKIENLDFLAGSPMGITLKPTISSGEKWIYEPKLAAFTNPNLLDVDWGDDKQDLEHAPAFLLLIENVEVQTSDGPDSLLDLVEKEIGHIRSRNPELNFQLRQIPAILLKELKFKSVNDRHRVVWVEGDIANYQVKRILLVALEHAFKKLAQDPAYVRKKDHT